MVDEHQNAWKTRVTSLGIWFYLAALVVLAVREWCF